MRKQKNVWKPIVSRLTAIPGNNPAIIDKRVGSFKILHIRVRKYEIKVWTFQSLLKSSTLVKTGTETWASHLLDLTDLIRHAYSRKQPVFAIKIFDFKTKNIGIRFQSLLSLFSLVFSSRSFSSRAILVDQNVTRKQKNVRKPIVSRSSNVLIRRRNKIWNITRDFWVLGSCLENNNLINLWLA